jgi:hypothetical protein
MSTRQLDLLGVCQIGTKGDWMRLDRQLMEETIGIKTMDIGICEVLQSTSTK